MKKISVLSLLACVMAFVLLLTACEQPGEQIGSKPTTGSTPGNHQTSGTQGTSQSTQPSGGNEELDNNEGAGGNEEIDNDEGTGDNEESDNKEDVVTPEEIIAQMTFEKYRSLSSAEQAEFRNLFDTVSDFFVWYNAAKAEYEENRDEIEVGDGKVDLGDIMDGKG